ncbi:MAG: hypothetical protein KatS3mg058_1981 [Roseiflexus sp.]|nr:MAG: hypothetical protein KatS3mg058_1981 [Roseiflexus sp.]
MRGEALGGRSEGLDRLHSPSTFPPATGALHPCATRLAPRPSLQMRDTSRATPLSGPSRLAPRYKCEIHLARRHCRDPRASPLATNARYISRDAIVGTLAPLTSLQMRDTSRATPLSGPSRLSTNARYISRDAMVGTLSPRPSLQMRDTSRATPWSGPSHLAPRYKCEIHLALRHGRNPRASPFATNARYISRYAMVGTLAPRPSLQMRDTSRATPWSGPSRLAPRASHLATNAR